MMMEKIKYLKSFSKQKSAKHRSSISSGLDSDKVQVLLKTFQKSYLFV